MCWPIHQAIAKLLFYFILAVTKEPEHVFHDCELFVMPQLSYLSIRCMFACVASGRGLQGLKWRFIKLNIFFEVVRGCLVRESPEMSEGGEKKARASLDLPCVIVGGLEERGISFGQLWFHGEVSDLLYRREKGEIAALVGWIGWRKRALESCYLPGLWDVKGSRRWLCLVTSSGATETFGNCSRQKRRISGWCYMILGMGGSRSWMFSMEILKSHWRGYCSSGKGIFLGDRSLFWWG